MHAVDAAVRGACRIGGPDGGGGCAEADLLALHVHAGVGVGGDQSRGGLGLGPIDRGRGRQHEQRHHRHQRAGVLAGQDHAAEGDHAGVAQDIHLHDLDQVGDRVRVLEGVGGVGVEDAAAVGAELLDRLLAGGGEQGDRLLGAFQRGRIGVGGKGLRLAQRHKGQGDDDRQRQQDVEADAGQIDPEVANLVATVGRECARHRRRNRNAGRRRQEVVRRQAGHLREGRKGGLAAIELPVGVGDETDRRVERQVRRHAREPLGVQRQQVLEPKDQIQPDEARRAERQERAGVAEPALAFVRVDAEGLVEDALHGPQHRVEPGALALPDPGHVHAQRPGQDDSEGDRENDLAPSSRVHGEVSSQV